MADDERDPPRSPLTVVRLGEDGVAPPKAARTPLDADDPGGEGDERWFGADELVELTRLDLARNHASPLEALEETGPLPVLDLEAAYTKLKRPSPWPENMRRIKVGSVLRSSDSDWPRQCAELSALLARQSAQGGTPRTPIVWISGTWMQARRSDWLAEAGLEPDPAAAEHARYVDACDESEFIDQVFDALANWCHASDDDGPAAIPVLFWLEGMPDYRLADQSTRLGAISFVFEGTGGNGRAS